MRGWKRRLNAGESAFAFKGFQQGCFFAADVGPGPSVYPHVDVDTRSENVLPDVTSRPRFIDRMFQNP